MKFESTALAGATLIDLEPHADERGFFARAWCQKEFTEFGLNANVAQVNLSFNHKAGTLRGLHYQVSPFREAKLVRCISGAIHDVIVDLRPDSATFLHWIGVDLSADNRRTLFVPEGFGHGFQTLQDNTEVLYQVSEFYTPGAERGLRFDDPAFAIKWPREVAEISDKDAAWPPYADGVSP